MNRCMVFLYTGCSSKCEAFPQSSPELQQCRCLRSGSVCATLYDRKCDCLPCNYVVTGSSSGFGRHITELALQSGDIAIATLRSPAALADLASQYGPDKLLILRLDVSKPDEIREAFAKAKEAFGRIDVVFNNAGSGLMSEVEGTPDDVARAMFEVNFWGAANVSQEAVRFFREINVPAGGRLLQVSSSGGVQGLPAIGYYCASKFGAFSDVFARTRLDSSVASN